MLKICADSIVKLLELIFKSCIDSGKFPTEWEKANAPVHIKKWKTSNRSQLSNFVAACFWEDTRTTNNF